MVQARIRTAAGVTLRREHHVNVVKSVALKLIGHVPVVPGKRTRTEIWLRGRHDVGERGSLGKQDF